MPPSAPKLLGKMKCTSTSSISALRSPNRTWTGRLVNPQIRLLNSTELWNPRKNYPIKPEADPTIGRGRAVALSNASREIPSPPRTRDENHHTKSTGVARRERGGAVGEAARKGGGGARLQQRWRGGEEEARRRLRRGGEEEGGGGAERKRRERRLKRLGLWKLSDLLNFLPSTTSVFFTLSTSSKIN
jgi:hypothetical protein